MSISPIGQQKNLQLAHGGPPAAPYTEPKRPRTVETAPALRTVTVDLPDAMPGRLQLDVDRESGRVIGRIIDKESGRLIRQIPTDEALQLAASVEALVEPLFDGRA